VADWTFFQKSSIPIIIIAMKPRLLAIQNDPTDPPHLVGRWLMEIGFEIEILRAYDGEDVPTTVPENIAGVIPLGGHMGALDDHIAPWLVNERALLLDAVTRNIPIFAICLGAQLLAAAAGGSVTRTKSSEIGIYDISPTSEGEVDPIFTLSSHSPVAQWHEDEVSQLPTGATLLASSELCLNQVYRIGSAQYAVQFHPEVDSSIIHTWEANADNAFLESGKSSVESEVRSAEEQLFATWKPVVQKWGRLVLESALV
jgi:GMP synthase-like glutamine amidotransferase